MKITATIEPIPLGRARVVGKRLYLPTRSRQFRQALQMYAKAAMAGRGVMTEPVKVTIRLYKKYKCASRGYGDLDNHCKAILDALNGIVWADDSQVIELHAFKCGGTPKIEIEIEAIP